MARKKGSKNKPKVDQVIDQITGTPDTSASQSDVSKNVNANEGAMPNADHGAVDFTDTDRAEAYKEFSENRESYEPTLTSLMGPEGEPTLSDFTEKEPAEEEVSAESDTETLEVTDTEKTADTEFDNSEDTDTGTEKPVTGFKPRELDDKDKTVSHGAFHEEREKRKAEAELRKKVEEERDALKERLAQFEGDDGEDDKLTQLQREIHELKKQQQERDYQSDMEATEKAILDVDKEMAKKGKPGFAKFGRNHVANILNNLRYDRPELAVKYDNPEGWAEIWNAEYDLVKSFFSESFKKEHLSEKKDKKSKAGLISSSGKTPVKAPAKESEYSYEKYAEWREKQIL